jgi:hypothetical protein
MDNDERRPRGESGADTNDRVQFTTLGQVRADLKWHFYWKRQYPEAFRNPHELARCGARAENAAKAYEKNRGTG